MQRISWFRNLLLSVLTLVVIVACQNSPQVDPPQAGTESLEQLEFGVGPYFPTPNETRDQFVPFFNELAKSVNVPADVVITEDWIGISEALRSRTLDVAWLGPWGYVLAHHNTPEIEGIATVKYKGEPYYHSVLIARTDAPYDTLEEALEYSQQQEELRLSLADVGSTSGWLIPQAEFARRGIDPEVVFDYSEGASHTAQALALINNQVDIASDYDRNLDVLASTGRIDPDQIKIIWQSDPLPNDPIAIRGGLPEEVKQGLQEALVNLSPEEAETLLPENYTGFVASDGSNYDPIRQAGEAVGKLE